MQNIAKNIARVKFGMGKARLVVVTKGISIDDIKAAIGSGADEIGENRVQEAAGKFGGLRLNKITTHMIGHLQRNKVKDAVALFDAIQSVDSIALARKIADQAKRQKKRIVIYLQLNVSGKESQSGFGIGEIKSAAKEIRALEGEFFALDGLMCIASKENAREDFRIAKKIADTLMLRTLSMGMSGDYEIALEEGANMVRLGGAIFGGRTMQVNKNSQPHNAKKDSGFSWQEE